MLTYFVCFPRTVRAKSKWISYRGSGYQHSTIQFSPAATDWQLKLDSQLDRNTGTK